MNFYWLLKVRSMREHIQYLLMLCVSVNKSFQLRHDVSLPLFSIVDTPLNLKIRYFVSLVFDVSFIDRSLARIAAGFNAVQTY